MKGCLESFGSRVMQQSKIHDSREGRLRDSPEEEGWEPVPRRRVAKADTGL